MSLQKSYLGSAKTYIFSKNQINNMEFFNWSKYPNSVYNFSIFQIKQKL